MAELTPEDQDKLDHFAKRNAGELRCPRCGQDSLHHREVMNAVSRVDNETYICNGCGTQESMEDYMNPGQPMTKDRWVVK